MVGSQPTNGRWLVGGWLVIAAGALVAVALAPGSTVALAAVGVVAATFVASVIGLSTRDAAAVLTLLFGLLFLLPEPYVLVGPLKSVGQPAQLVGILALVLWASGRLLGSVPARASHPMRWAALLFTLTATSAFAAGMMRPLSDLEASGASRSPFPIAASLGILLLACDAITRRDRLDTLLQRLVLIGGIAALIGVLEFTLHGLDYRSLTKLPGLTINVTVVDGTRSDFDRVDGAASHPIEYAVAIACLVPLALHFTANGRTRLMRQLSGLATILLLLVLPMTVSRSAILAVVVGLLVYGVVWTGRQKLNALVLGLIGLAAFRAAVPGLLGTLRSLIFVGTADPSISGRTEDYAKLPALLDGHTWFGRGLGTFQPLQYFYLDNQYLGSLLEGGVVALASLIVLLVVGMSVARGARKRSGDRATRSLGQALAASIAALAASCATFDELSFLQTAFLLFLLCGCAGALWSMSHEARASEGATQQPTSPAPSGSPTIGGRPGLGRALVPHVAEARSRAPRPR